MFRSRLLTAALTLVALTGCSSSIRVVQKTPVGGVVALEGPREKAREKAVEFMLEQCPGGYDVLEDRELDGEERMAYRCSGAPPDSASRSVVVRVM
jgi:hypothetical protein